MPCEGKWTLVTSLGPMGRGRHRHHYAELKTPTGPVLPEKPESVSIILLNLQRQVKETGGGVRSDELISDSGQFKETCNAAEPFAKIRSCN